MLTFTFNSNQKPPADRTNSVHSLGVPNRESSVLERKNSRTRNNSELERKRSIIARRSGKHGSVLSLAESNISRLEAGWSASAIDTRDMVRIKSKNNRTISVILFSLLISAVGAVTLTEIGESGGLQLAVAMVTVLSFVIFLLSVYINMDVLCRKLREMIDDLRYIDEDGYIGRFTHYMTPSNISLATKDSAQSVTSTVEHEYGCLALHIASRRF